MNIVTDTTVKKELDLPNTTFYDWKKRDPRAVELIKKGLVAEQLLSNDIFEDMIKKPNGATK